MVRPLKHDSKTQQTIELRKEHPDWSLGKIGKELRITRVSVWETLKRYNKQTISVKLEKPPRLCVVCFNPIINFKSKYFCSHLCRKKHISFSVKCRICGKIVFRIPYRIKKNFFHGRQKRFYCTKKHFYERFAKLDKL